MPRASRRAGQKRRAGFAIAREGPCRRGRLPVSAFRRTGLARCLPASPTPLSPHVVVGPAGFSTLRLWRPRRPSGASTGPGDPLRIGTPPESARWTATMRSTANRAKRGSLFRNTDLAAAYRKRSGRPLQRRRVRGDGPIPAPIDPGRGSRSGDSRTTARVGGSSRNTQHDGGRSGSQGPRVPPNLLRKSVPPASAARRLRWCSGGPDSRSAPRRLDAVLDGGNAKVGGRHGHD